MSYLVYLFPLYFLGAFGLTIFIISKFGWTKLAEHFRFYDIFNGQRIGIISAKINRIDYNNCLQLLYNSEGFYIKPIFIFRLFHPPVFIPWKAVTGLQDKTIWREHFKVMIIGDPLIGKITIKESTYFKMQQNLAQQ